MELTVLTTAIKGFFGSIFSNINTILIVATIAAVLGGVWYVHNLSSEVADLTASNKIYQQEVVDANNDIKGLQGSFTTMNDIMTKLNAQIAAEQARIEALDKLLDSIDNTAKTNPAAATTLVNNEFKDRMRCLALSTGAAPLKGETNALCPELVITAP